ncbi:cellulose synthase-like protein G3 [Nicotiana tabacum]|uniref:Cellulose synthase-like protein CslG n=1 Tax=Nicotiana tabacum TaxID=4097 RepID=Q3Y6V1_TOBAC|nr:cellulose synthase-like protein G3 [Nicotiana tabacum]AAZ79231.1 cellulose synthase-like protein CslG [Nicotiana tabacum]
METTATGASTTTTVNGGLHSLKVKPLQLILNRAFALIYLFAILALFYNHTLKLLNSTSFISFSILFLILISDIILAFMWSTVQSFRMRPLIRTEYPEKLKNFSAGNFPSLDIFICTADPYKEPPLNVVNTALSVMAYDYPIEKVSVYVSDDGGSELTLFAFMEAAKFAVFWLPFCRENKIVERCPDAYFSSNYTEDSETQKIKLMYESMKTRIENVVERGKVEEDYINNEEERQIFSKYWTAGFTRHNHPSIIQVLLESGKDRDITGDEMPNLIYLSREKSKNSPHYFKAGALNALLRVSGIMTNAPIVLTLDCDMYSNDPSTPKRALCYFLDQTLRPNLAYVQFPQRFHGLNDADIYGSEIKGLFHTNPLGMDGLHGPNYVGTGCFFRRRAFFGNPSLFEKPEIPELFPDHDVNKPIQAHEVLQLAHQVASCNYENESNWGSKMGFRYGSLVEDYYTGYRLQCEGWKSVFCNPKRPAFLGDVPISLHDVISQNKRWSVGLLEVAFSKYSPLTFGVRSMGFVMAHCYAHYAFWPIWSLPIAIYAFIPQLTLLNGVPIFPKVSDPWFFLYVFLFLGAYGQDCLIFMSAQGTWKRWWNDQRIWMIRGLTSFLFGTIEYVTKHLGMTTQGFSLTSKVVDDDQGKRYHQGVFEFGVVSPMFVTLATTTIINLVAFLKALIDIFKGDQSLDALYIQLFISAFVVINCLPIYEAMVLRADKGRMPTKVTIISTFLVGILYIVFSFILRNV